jgi:L-cystine uptake protein TcyP (sodium:dicarboxylate symporter family)
MGNTMAEQNYQNHAQMVPPFHYVVLPILFLTFIGSIVNLTHSWGDHERFYSAALIVALSFAATLGIMFGRMFALKAQDRAIRAEENLRHFAMTGKLLDPRLSALQIVALRFASDGEFVALAQRAAKEDMKPADIKQAVKSWRADYYRV